MVFKFVLLVACAVFASANAGLTVTSGSDNTYRSQGNLAQVSTQTKSIETPYSSSTKSDVRVSNPSVYVTAQPALSYSAHAAPVYATASPAAIYANEHAKIAYASPAPAYSYAAAPSAHASYYAQQQQQQQQQPSYVAHSVYPAGQRVYAAAPAPIYAKATFAAPAAYHVAQPAQLAYSAPAAVYSHAAPSYNYAGYAHAAPAPVATAHHQPLVKVAYSPAAEVSHFTYSNVNDHTNYGW